jgi:murein tripeptide amidase MpaA
MSDMPEPIVHQRFDPTQGDLSYYTYETLTRYLRELVAAHPGLATLESIGKSYEGRDVWLVTLTNHATGPALEKPAYWIDGNTHAGEVTGSTVVLYTIWRYLSQYGQDARITRILDRHAIYLLPRISVDGADVYLTTPERLRSSTRLYPYEEQRAGLSPSDIDGNGLIRQMRFKDPNGAFVKSARDPRIMRPRPIDDDGDGEYYTVVAEGMIHNYDGVSIPIAPPRRGLDINRNYPYFWETEGVETGPGPYPFSEPETRVEAEFWRTHPNINGAVSYHTESGVLLRPYGTHPDEHFPTADLDVYKAMGQRGTEITGYPCISTYHDFRYDPKEVMHGAMDDYAYEYQGWFAFTPELWDLPKMAGIGPRDWIGWIRWHSEEDDLKLMRWNDEEEGGQAFMDWTPFEHPQLGPVEIGGWDDKFHEQNLPVKYLPDLCETMSTWTLSTIVLNPWLSLPQLTVSALGDDSYLIKAVVQNNGFLPTYTSQKALERQVVRPIEVELILPAGVQLVSGKRQQGIGHLEGRSNKISVLWNTPSPTDNRTALEWVVSGPAGTQIELVVRAQRAGTVRQTVDLSQRSA